MPPTSIMGPESTGIKMPECQPAGMLFTNQPQQSGPVWAHHYAITAAGRNKSGGDCCASRRVQAPGLTLESLPSNETTTGIHNKPY